MTNIIQVDFKQKQLAPKMRWTKEEIQDAYESEIDPQQYNLQTMYDYDAYWCFEIE